MAAAPTIAEPPALRFVRFAALEAWGYAAMFAPKKHKPTFPTVPLGELIAQRKGFIRIDDATRYQRCRVQLRAQGVVLRDEVLGSGIKTKSQQVCRAGDFLVAEIDAKLGGFGIVPPELEGAVVSSHYFLFEVNEERLSREYLALCLATEFFQKQVKSTGSTNYAAIRPHHVLGYRIPLPPLAEQARLVAAHRLALAEAEAAEARARAGDHGASLFLETALGLQTKAGQPKLVSGKLHYLAFATMERWDVISDTASISAKYPLVELGSITTTIRTGTTPPTARKDYFDGDVPFFTPADLGTEPVLLRSGRTVTRLALADKRARVFNKDTLLFVGIGSSVGKVGVVGIEVATANQQITGLSLDSTKANARFVHAWLDANKELSTREKAQTTLPIISQERILRIPVPLPPLREQARIVARLDALRAEARAARTAAERLRASAANHFNAALFSTRP